MKYSETNNTVIKHFEIILVVMKYSETNKIVLKCFGTNLIVNKSSETNKSSEFLCDKMFWTKPSSYETFLKNKTENILEHT